MPLHKKNDPLDKENYRPVSILPIISKVYERAMHNQLSVVFFLTIFSIPIWQPFVRVLDVSLPCCAFSRTGGRPWTTISLL